MKPLEKPGCYGFVRKDSGEVVYVGESVNLRKRLYEHSTPNRRSKQAKKVLYDAFDKYGYNMFRFVVFEYCDTKEQAIQLEIKYHERYRPRYSIAPPGGFIKPAEFRPFTLLNVETGELRSFNTKPEADRELNMTAVRLLNGSRNKERGWVGKYDDDNTSWEELFIRGTTKPRKGKKIYQYTLEGEFVAEYRTAQEASRKTGIARSGISQAKNKENRSAGGFKWKGE